MVGFEEIVMVLGACLLLTGTMMLGSLIGGFPGIVAGAMTGFGILCCFLMIFVQAERLCGKH